MKKTNGITTVSEKNPDSKFWRIYSPECFGLELISKTSKVECLPKVLESLFKLNHNLDIRITDCQIIEDSPIKEIIAWKIEYNE